MTLFLSELFTSIFSQIAGLFLENTFNKKNFGIEKGSVVNGTY